MKTNTTLALLAALGLASAELHLQAQPSSPEPGHKPQPPHARLAEVLQTAIVQSDANQDGQLDTTELAALKDSIAQGTLLPPGPPNGERRGFGFGRSAAHIGPELLQKYDQDQDGKLNEEERAALHQDVQAGKVNPPMLGRGPGGGQRMHQTAGQILQRFDADQDGKLDETELQSFLESAPRPPMERRFGLRGPVPPETPEAP